MNKTDSIKIGRRLQIDKQGNIECKHCGTIMLASNITHVYLKCRHCNKVITGSHESTIKELIKFILKSNS